MLKLCGEVPEVLRRYERRTKQFEAWRSDLQAALAAGRSKWG